MLEDGDVTLYEAAAIDGSLAEKHGSGLRPAGPDRFHTLKWMAWAAEHFRQGPPALFNERIAKRFMGVPAGPRAVAGTESSVQKYGTILDEHLAGRFVVGDRFTLADIDRAAPLSQMTRSKLPMEPSGNILSWYSRLTSDVPAWRHTGDLLESRMEELQAALNVGSNPSPDHGCSRIPTLEECRHLFRAQLLAMASIPNA